MTLLGRWKMASTDTGNSYATDIINGNNAVFQGSAPTWSTPGPYSGSSSLSFANAGTQLAKVTNASVLTPTGNTITVMGWCLARSGTDYTNATYKALHGAFTKDVSGAITNAPFWIGIDATGATGTTAGIKWAFGVTLSDNSSATARTNGTTNFALDTWTHVAGTYDGATLTLYINGQLISTAALAGAAKTIGSTTGSLWIGQQKNGQSPTRYWYGQVCDCTIDDVALPQFADNGTARISIAEAASDPLMQGATITSLLVNESALSGRGSWPWRFELPVNEMTPLSENPGLIVT